MRQARGEARHKAIAESGTDDWQRRRNALHRSGWAHRGSQDDIRLQLDQFLCQSRQLFSVTIGIAIIDVHGSALDIAETLQSIAEGGKMERVGCRRVNIEKSDTGTSARSARGERPHGGAAETDDEFPPSDVDRHLTLRRGRAGCNVGKRYHDP